MAQDPVRRDPAFPTSAELDAALPEGLYDVFLASTGVNTDTRSLAPGQLFVALKGPNFNGNRFAASALDAGAAGVLLDEAPEDPALAADARVRVVPSALRALQALARHHRRRFGFPVFALTGSNGKTTTKELLAAVLARRYRVAATKGNLNNHIGVPLTLLSVPPDAELAVVEMGANAQREIAGLCVIAEPDAGLITNIGDAHLEGFGGHAGVQKGKGELFAALKARGGTIFCWWDQAELRDLGGDYAPMVRYGTGPEAAVRGEPLPGGRFAGVRVAFARTGEDPAPTVAVHSHLVGAYNVPNLLAAAAVGAHYGVAPDAIAAALEAYRPSNQRSEWREHGANTLYLDAYNANPSSMRGALESLRDLETERRKGAILGDMLELGEHEAAEHRGIAELAGGLGLDPLVFIGPRFGAVPLPEGARHFPDAAAAAAWLREQGLRDRVLLLKGSRGIGVERTLEGLS